MSTGETQDRKSKRGQEESHRPGAAAPRVLHGLWQPPDLAFSKAESVSNTQMSHARVNSEQLPGV